MRTQIIILGLIGLTVLGGLVAKLKFYDPKHRLDNGKSEKKQLVDNENIKNGDLIFQTSLSGQSKAIQLATNSRYSHCGLILKDGNGLYVFEAVQPVKRTPLNRWIARGQGGKYVIKRLKNADQFLTSATVVKMKQVSEEFNGKTTT